jgi:hypothetical protein
MEARMQAEAMTMAPTLDRPGEDVPPRPDAPAARTAPEPATPRALWPTFMRRTLAEELLRREAPRPRA